MRVEAWRLLSTKDQMLYYAMFEIQHTRGTSRKYTQEAALS